MNEELKVIITAEINQLKKEVGDAKKQIENFTQNSNKNSKSFGEGMKKAGSVAGTAIKGILGVIAAAGAAIIGLSESTK